MCHYVLPCSTGFHTRRSYWRAKCTKMADIQVNFSHEEGVVEETRDINCKPGA